jgi:hypothetical protein
VTRVAVLAHNRAGGTEKTCGCRHIDPVVTSANRRQLFCRAREPPPEPGVVAMPSAVERRLTAQGRLPRHKTRERRSCCAAPT